jgi:hypothetical protein
MENTYKFKYKYYYICNKKLYITKLGLLEKTKEGGKEQKNGRVNNNEKHHICEGTRHNKMH